MASSITNIESVLIQSPIGRGDSLGIRHGVVAIGPRGNLGLSFVRVAGPLRSDPSRSPAMAAKPDVRSRGRLIWRHLQHLPNQTLASRQKRPSSGMSGSKATEMAVADPTEPDELRREPAASAAIALSYSNRAGSHPPRAGLCDC